MRWNRAIVGSASGVWMHLRTLILEQTQTFWAAQTLRIAYLGSRPKTPYCDDEIAIVGP